jgi:DDE superfamily endonuclease
MSRYRSRKGRISTNLLAACQFDLLFCYLLPGWEGSAADGRVFDHACRKDFEIPSGIYYLADAGFPLCDALMTPYLGVRYHLKEWAQSGLRYSHLISRLSPIFDILQTINPSKKKSSSIFVMPLSEMLLSAFLVYASVASS